MAAILAGAGGGASAEQAKGLAGQLLVASDQIGDPRFDKTVIYMVEHDQGGAMGLVVNRPLGRVPIAEMLDRLGLEREEASGEIGVFYGGPVEPGRGFLLHSTDYLGEGSIVVDDQFAVTLRPDILTAISRGEGPARSLFALGYAGWGPGQLESELARHAWFVVPAEPSLVFADDPQQSWQRAVARKGIDL